MKGFFGSRPQIGEVILKSIRTLKVQKLKIEQVTFRLHQRDRILFQSCVDALKNNNRERAAICASELAEVRKLLKFLKQVQLALERVMLRLETIKELNDIVTELKPALRMLKDVSGQLSETLPHVSLELEKVSESINETLALTKMNAKADSLISLDVKTPGGQEVLKEVSSLLEQEIAEKLPEPPTSMPIQEVGEAGEVKEMVALAASCSEATQEESKHFAQRTLSYEDIELQKLSLKIQRKSGSLEDTVLEYVRKRNGEINVTECALDLKVSPQDVEEALKTLSEKGKVKIYVS